MSHEFVLDHNPYPGPRPFQESETLYGREQEVDDLVDLLTAERIVLLYAPSGAGKTSLIQASLIPELRRRQFRVLPPIRLLVGDNVGDGQPAPVPAAEVAVGAPAVGAANRYVRTTLLTVAGARHDSTAESPGDRPLGPELRAGLDAGLEPAEGRQAEVLIFDQFEEVLTDPLVDDATRADFFRQVGAALRDPWRWALFAMREEFLAGLDPYRRWIPHGFRTTYRLELLRAQAAMTAIQEPARHGIPAVEFPDDAADALVRDLRRTRDQSAGLAGARLGEYVEPVQLQVVCRRLWERGVDAGRITVADVRGIDVDRALRDYYAEKVQAAASAAGLSERTIRIWIDEKLITPDGMRDQVMNSPGSSEGLSNRALEVLAACHLVRADSRGDRRWWELAHDRLIEPVRDDNREWLEGHLQPWQKVARVWNDDRDRQELLLRGKRLADAERFKAEHPDEVSEAEKEFLIHSQLEQKRAFRSRLKWLALVGTLGLLGLSVFLLYQQSVEAEAQKKSLHAERLTTRALSPSIHPDLSPVLALAALNIDSRLSTLNALVSGLVSRSHFRAYHGNSAGEPHQIHAVAYSPNGRLMAAEGPGGTINLRDAETQELRQTLPTTSTQVWSLAFSPDGRWLASGGADGTIAIWDLSAGLEPANVCKPHSTEVSSLAFKPGDSTTLASSGSKDGPDTRLVVSRVPDCGTIKSLEQDGKQHGTEVWTLAFDPQGERLVSAGHDGTFIVWNTAIWQPAATQVLAKWSDYGGVFLVDLVQTCPAETAGRRLVLTRESGELKPCFESTRSTGEPVGRPDGVAIWSVAFSPDGKDIAIASQEHNVLIVETRTFRRRLELPAVHQDSVRAVAYHGDSRGKWLASAGLDDLVVLWDLQSYQTSGQWSMARLEGHTNWVWSLAFGPGGHLASASYDGSVRVWSLWPEPAGASLLSASMDGSWGLAFNRDGDMVASGGTDSKVTFTNVSSHEATACPTRVQGDLTAVTSIAPASTGKIASGVADGSILLWDPPSCERSVLGTHPSGVWSVAFSPNNGRTLATGGADGSIRLWDVERPGNSVGTFHPHAWGKVWTLAFSPDGQLLASGGADRSIVISDLQGRIVQRLTGDDHHMLDVRSVAFSPNGRWLASGSHDRRIGIWNVGTWQRVRWLRGHKDVVASVAFSLDSRYLYSGAWDGRIIRWDLETGAPSWSFNGHDGNIWSVSVSPKNDGRLASGDDAGVLLLWEDPDDLAPQSPFMQSLTRKACAVAASRVLERDTLRQYEMEEQDFKNLAQRCPDAALVSARTAP
jgi:WD40 repeat protein